MIKILQSNIGNDDISVAVKSSNRMYIIIRRLVSVLSVLWLHFCDYLPFEAELAVYLKNLIPFTQG